MTRFQFTVDVVIPAFARRFGGDNRTLSCTRKSRLFSKQLRLPFCHLSEYEKCWSEQSDLNRRLTVLQTVALIRLAMLA